ncbi:inositol monophosphatase family protein [Aquipuribacter sp. MA13-6]|uniref:inositol monophosphatase family protein n=1 Tax=unclassified Aquipuribacter TaxID=2635084 RepID=UPI003EE8DD8E
MTASPAAEQHPSSEDLRALARDLARAAGAVLREHRRGVVTVARTKSSGTDVVTAADLASERELRRLLALARPDDGVLGEEEGGEAGRSGLTWVVDPLDGTVNFLYDTGTWSVSVAVVSGPPDPEHWQVLAGAVYDVERDQMYSASAGGGADLDGTALQASACASLDACLLSTGFAYDAAVRAEQARAVARLLPQVRDVRRIGSAAVDLCMVGAGRLDAHVERGLNPWDHAAGALVAAEAGAVVTARDDRRPGADLLVAAAPGVAAALRAAVTASGY